MIDPALHPAPRSVVAIANLELLRVARTELDEPGPPAGVTIGQRIRGLARFRVGQESRGSR